MILENLKTSGVQQAHKEDRNYFHRLYAVAPANWSALKAAISKVLLNQELGSGQRFSLARNSAR